MDGVKRLHKVQHFTKLSRFVLFSGPIHTHHVNKTEYNETSPYVFRGGGTSLKCLLQLYFSAACVCILSVFCSHFGVSNHGAALNHLSNGPTGSDSCASEIKIFCASSPAIVSPLGYRNKKKRGVLTFPEVPECVKGNSKRVTE